VREVRMIFPGRW